jgi:galactokinase
MSNIPANLQSLVSTAKTLFDTSFPNPIDAPTHITTAPGRVNLIGEHTDYTGGFVLPLAIGYSTVIYGRGSIVKNGGKCRVVSSNDAQIVEFEADPSAVPSTSHKWTNYVQGVVLQYLPDLKSGESFSMDVAIAGNVPLGSGLSSSASLEVATAAFLECILNEGASLTCGESKKERAVRCQRAENVFCSVPCGIMVSLLP